MRINMPYHLVFQCQLCGDEFISASVPKLSDVYEYHSLTIGLAEFTAENCVLASVSKGTSMHECGNRKDVGFGLFIGARLYTYPATPTDQQEESGAE
jgi:hypothetical protein